MTEVWIIETGEYEQRGVFGIADSLESAVRYVKDEYGPPYIVEWGELEREGNGAASIVGRFQQVVGYSTQHTASFDISPEPVRTRSEGAEGKDEA